MDEINTSNKEYSVFISHKLDDRSLALKIKEALENLCGKDRNRLNVFVCETTPGGTDWRQWIAEKIAGSTVLIFLYTDMDADWSWCQFEVGSFIGTVEPGKRPRPVLCLKNSTIVRLPSTIADFQAYNADNEGIKKLFEELLNGDKILGERLNPDLKSGTYEEQFSRYVQDVVTRFTVTTKTNFFDRRMDITLNEDAGRGAAETDIEKASIFVDPITMSFLDLPHQNARWTDLATTFRKRDQSVWIDQLEESVKQIENGEKPLEVLEPFKLRDGNAYIPVIARIETLQRRDEKRTITPKMIRVIFVPSPKSEAMPTLAEFFDDPLWMTYTPACVVRLKWQKKSGDAYKKEDMMGDIVCCAFNHPFADLFDRKYQVIKEKPLRVDELLPGIEDYMSEKNMATLKDDQAEVFDRIIFKDRNAVPKVPLQFNDKHPYPQYQNQAFLPVLIGKQVIGEMSGPHETYLLVCYIKDFFPSDESEQT